MLGCDHSAGSECHNEVVLMVIKKAGMIGPGGDAPKRCRFVIVRFVFVRAGFLCRRKRPRPSTLISLMKAARRGALNEAPL